MQTPWDIARAWMDEHRFGSRFSKKSARAKEPSRVAAFMNAWWTRLLNSIYEGGFGEQDAEYAEHSTSRDYIWNTAGSAVWGFTFPLLTIVATQLAGAAEAGRFSMAFVTGTLLMIICMYGVRNVQVSDLEEEKSFSSYQVQRWVCGVLALLIGIAYNALRAYDAHMATICMGVYVYKMIDGVADVYEGRLQQADKLYLGGVSQTVRSVLVIALFSLVLFITRSIALASIAMAAAAVVSMAFVTLPLALLETEKSRGFEVNEVTNLFQLCWPILATTLLFNLIESMPKFVMEGALEYENQLYFNALYFPAQAILLAIGFVYKPQLLRLSNIWANPTTRRKFDLIMAAVLGVVVLITVVMELFMGACGVQLLSTLYGLDFEQFRVLAYLMVLAGGITAAIDFIAAIVTLLRRTDELTRCYLVSFALAVVIPVALVPFFGLVGAVISYLATMTVLLALMCIEYFHIRGRIELERNPYRRKVQK